MEHKEGESIGPIADGYLTASGYDGYTYVFGKGKSETTVTAPDVAVPKGTAITIKGTVLDMSPAQPVHHVSPKNQWQHKWSTCTCRCQLMGFGTTK